LGDRGAGRVSLLGDTDYMVKGIGTLWVQLMIRRSVGVGVALLRRPDGLGDARETCA
jgi:hypothetical protein